MKHLKLSILPEILKLHRLLLTTEKKPIVINQIKTTDRLSKRRHNYFVWRRRGAMLARWLHIYLSMISFAIVFFFAVTGLTLNHADKFGDQLHSVQEKGKMSLNWV